MQVRRIHYKRHIINPQQIKQSLKIKYKMKAKNIGLDVIPPSGECNDKKCHQHLQRSKILKIVNILILILSKQDIGYF